MKKTDRKKLAGAGLYIALAACVLSAMTINVVSGIKNKSSGEDFELSAVDLRAEGVTDSETPTSKPKAEEKTENVSSATPLVKQEIVTGKVEALEKSSEDTQTAPEQTPPAEENKENADKNASAPQYPDFVLPVNGELGTYKGATLLYSEVFGDYRVHDGIDITAKLGDSVMAFCDGTVMQVYDHALMGKTIVIDHGNGLTSVYKNLAEDVPQGIEAGASVKAGDIIGAVGNSSLAKCTEAPHLHFEVCYNEENVDPTQYFMTAGK